MAYNHTHSAVGFVGVISDLAEHRLWKKYHFRFFSLPQSSEIEISLKTTVLLLERGDAIVCSEKLSLYKLVALNFDAWKMHFMSISRLSNRTLYLIANSQIIWSK